MLDYIGAVCLDIIRPHQKAHAYESRSFGRVRGRVPSTKQANRTFKEEWCLARIGWADNKSWEIKVADRQDSGDVGV